MKKATTKNIPPYVAEHFGAFQGSRPRLEAIATLWAARIEQTCKPLLRGKARHLLIHLARRCNRFGKSEHYVCWPKISDLAADIHASNSTVDELLKILQSQNMIAIHKAAIVNGMRRNNCYELNCVRPTANCNYRFSDCNYHSNNCKLNCNYRSSNLKERKSEKGEKILKGSEFSNKQEKTREEGEFYNRFGQRYSDEDEANGEWQFIKDADGDLRTVMRDISDL